MRIKHYYPRQYFSEEMDKNKRGDGLPGEYPWISHYDKGVPRTLKAYPEHTILWYVSNSARLKPHHPAILFKNMCLGYSDLEQLSDTIAVKLIEHGLNKGDRLVLILPNCPQFIITELAAWKVGAIVTPVNPVLKGAELAELLTNSGAETCIVLTPYYTCLKEIQSQTPIKQIIVTDIYENFASTVKTVKDTPCFKHQSNDSWFTDLLNEQNDSPQLNVTTGSNDPAIILMSSGTTSSPKGVLLLKVSRLRMKP